MNRYLALASLTLAALVGSRPALAVTGNWVEDNEHPFVGLSGEEDNEPTTFESLLSGTASISLTGSSTRVSLTTDSEWSLDKTGSLSGNTVTWNIVATKTSTVSGHLVVQGTMAVTNTGNGPATVGNIVVNLQKRQGNNWITASSDIANATQGDAATTAKIHAAASSENKSSFSENSASGVLELSDASNNTLFSLVPQVLIGPGQTRTLLFSASFNNNDTKLKLTAGTRIRAEVIVTFGNATQNGNSTANVDINGNGVVDADEARVRSVPSRLKVTVPPAVNGNGTVTLTDTLADIATTGDVTFTNAQFNLGATTGTVRATVAAGPNDGSITNCAHLTGADQTANAGGFNFPVINGVDLTSCSTEESRIARCRRRPVVNGVDLTSCSTVSVAGTPPTCTPGAPGCGWEPGDMQTAAQTAWGDGTTTAGSLVAANFNSVYPGELVVGGTNRLILSNSATTFEYLPASGNPAVLTATVLDPQSTSAGELGGEVVALKLNVDFSALFGNAVPFGDLRICKTATALDEQTIAQFLATANQILGGGGGPFSASTTSSIANALNGAFNAGTPSSFAQANLFAAATCPTN